MPEDNRSFDVLGKQYDLDKDYVAALKACFDEINKTSVTDSPYVNASKKFIMKRQGDRVMLEVHMMEKYLDDNNRCQDFIKECHKMLADLVRDLKKAFKKKTKETLKVTELKTSAGWHREQVNLNGHWYLRVWRMYDVKPEADQSDEE